MKSEPILYITLMFLLILSGCVSIPFISKVTDELPDLKSQIISGETSKDKVHEMLGDPLITYERSNVEVFRALSGNDWVWSGFILMPIVTEKYDVIAYAMVVYDKDDIVGDLDWGLFGRTNDRSDNYREDLTLEVDDLVFKSEGCSPDFNIWNQLKACEYLYLNHLSSKTSLNSPSPKGKCLLTVDTGEFVNQMHIDNQLILDLDYSGLNGEFIQLELPAGEHTISMDNVGIVSTYEEAINKFTCSSEQRLFVYPIKHEDQTFWKWEPHKIEIVIENTPSEIFQNHKKLLFYEGQRLYK